ncbi:hypothetical protein ACTU6V_12340 [Microbacterium sp. A204]|uniref:hypothetical protein n=1 Tax=Microbacterium sp. A204 TaxID=3457321 RepID=UPI003FD16B2B
MATGDDALADGMDLVPGTALANTIDTEINKTRDYIVQRLASKIAALWPLPINRGGTGKTTVAEARAALGVWANSGATAPNTTPSLGWNGARLQYEIPGYVGAVNLANLSDISGGSYLPLSGGTVTGHIYVPNSVAATDGYTVAYINSDGRVSRGASSERYKKYISEIDPATLGDIWPNLVKYQMRQGDGSWKYGYIAERLAENPDQQPFVIYQTAPVLDENADTTTRPALDADGNPVPESIDFIALIMAQNAQLHTELVALRARVDALEAS